MPPEHAHRSDTWNLAPDALLLVDPEGTILDINDQARTLFAFPDLVGRQVDTIVPDEVDDHAALRRGFVAKPTRRAMGSGARLRAKRGDGTVFPVHIALSPLPGGLTLAAVRDQTDVQAVEHRMIDATRRRILAEEHERIARDLHDRIIQSLFALGMDLEAGVADAAADQTERMSRAVDTLDDVIRSIREVIFDVRRARPDDASLRGQVVAIATELIPSLGFEPALEFNGNLDDLDPDLAGHLVAVVRESLTNVARHAEATTATVRLSGSGAKVRVTVADDGLGMPAEPTRRSGHGNLADRARLASGSFRVDTRAEGGTMVEWSAPVNAS